MRYVFLRTQILARQSVLYCVELNLIQYEGLDFRSFELFVALLDIMQ